MISKRVQRSTQWLVHGSPSGSIGLPEAVYQVVSKGAILVIHRESTVPTVEVLLQLKLSAFTRRTIYSIIISIFIRAYLYELTRYSNIAGVILDHGWYVSIGNSRRRRKQSRAPFLPRALQRRRPRLRAQQALRTSS